jgi:hypothetical protein
MDVTFFEPQSYFSSSPTPHQKESQIDEDFLNPLPVPTPIPEQQVTNESPTEPTNKPSAPPVQELRGYSRH